MSLKAANKVDTNSYEIEVSIDGDAFEAAVNKTYNKQKNKIAIPGFRKGKAPRSFIEKYYGENIFYDDALELVYPDAVQGAIDEAGLKLVDTPSDVDVVSIGKDGVQLKMKITVEPEVEIGEYKGIKAAKKKVSVSEVEIDDEIKKLQERNARMVTVEGRAAKDGDITVIDFEGFVDGKAFEGGKAENYNLTLGSKQFIPGFEDQIVGHNANDEFDVNVTFPKDYDKKLAEKEAVFKVKLHEIKEKQLPEIDDEFAKDVSEFDNLQALRDDFKDKLTKRKTEQVDDDYENQLIDSLIVGLKADIPPVMFERRITENVKDFEYRLSYQGLNLDTYLKYAGLDMKGLRESLRAQSERQVKLRLILEKVVKLENIVPTEDELNEEYKKHADAYKVDIETIKKAIPKDEIVSDVAVQKAIKLVKDNSIEVAEVEKAEKVEKTEEAKTAKKAEKAEEEAPKPKKKAVPKKTTASKETAAKKTAAKAEPKEKKTAKKEKTEE